jgi:hypothetical protein
MSTTFSLDYSKLIISKVNSFVNILKVGRNNTTIKNADRLRYILY